MSTAVRPAAKPAEQDTTLPPHDVLGQREFLTTYSRALTSMMGELMQPIYTGSHDASVAQAGQVKLNRKPMGVQGFAAEALATGRSGRKPKNGQGGLHPLRGQFLVGEMATGKTNMSLLYLELADQLANSFQDTAPWNPWRVEAYPAIVLVPVTLLEKFAREALETIPGMKPVIVLPIRNGKRREEEEEAEDETTPLERELEAAVDAEGSLRAFDPTYDGRNLSAVGVLNRVARRIRFELAAWRTECQARTLACQQQRREARAAWKRERSARLSPWKEACAAAQQAGQPLPPRPELPSRPCASQLALPPKPKHLVILSQSVAKLGSAWKPSYVVRPLTMRVNGKVRLVRDEEQNPQFVPSCPRCGQPLILGTKQGPGGVEQIIYLTEQDLLGKEPGDRKKRRCTNVVRRWTPETQKYRQVPCREPLWQSIPALTPPRLKPVSARSSEERSAALPLPGAGQRFVRVTPAPSLAEWQASSADPAVRQRLALGYEADAWQWRPAAYHPHPPCVVEAPERRYPIADYIQEHYRGLFKTTLIDEVHQYSGAGTAQGYAAQALVDASDSALGMTGTLFGGFPRNVYHLLWRVTPEFRQDFGPRDVVRFVKLFGKQQRTYKERFDADGQPIGAVSKRRQEPEPKDLPGISPLVLKYLLPCMMTVELRDVWLKPTKYTEQVVMVEMGPVIGPAYDQMQRTSTQALRQLLARGDRRAVSAWFHGLLRYPNMPWEGMEIVHPSKQLVLGTAPKTPETYVSPKERQMLRDVRRERAEKRRDGGLGRRILIGCQSTNKHDLQPRLKRLLEEDDRRWRQGLPVLGSDGDPEDSTFPPRPASLPPIRVRILRSGSPAAQKREGWLRQAVHEGIDVLICHSKLVEVGLDLLAFPTIMAYEIIFSTTSMRQFFRRSWRPKQTEPVRVIQYCWEYAKLSTGTMETRGLELIATKTAVSMMLEGKLPPADSLARQVHSKGGMSDPMMELALAMVDANGEAEMRVRGSIEEAFRLMNETSEMEVFDQAPEEEEAPVAGPIIDAEVVAPLPEKPASVQTPTPAMAPGNVFLPALFDEPLPSFADVQPVPLFGFAEAMVVRPSGQKTQAPGGPSGAAPGQKPSAPTQAQPTGKKKRKRSKKQHGVPLFDVAEADAPEQDAPAQKQRQASHGQPPQSDQVRAASEGKRHKRQRHRHRQPKSQQGQAQQLETRQLSGQSDQSTPPRQAVGAAGPENQRARLEPEAPATAGAETPDALMRDDGSLWSDWGDEAGEPTQADLIAEAISTPLPAASPTLAPVITFTPDQQEALAEVVQEVESAALAAPSALTEEEVCAVCHAEVELYSSEGIPYCFAHAPLAAQAAETAVFPSPAMEDREALAVAAPQETLLELAGTQKTPAEHIALALQYLAGVCDGAHSLDGQGFNKFHARFGHDLARQSLQQPLRPKQLRSGLEMLWTYREQLAAAGLALPGRQQLERWIEAQAAQSSAPLGSGTFRLDGEQVIVRFHRGDPEKVRAIKIIRNRYGGGIRDGKPPSWVLPIGALEEVIIQFPDLESVA